MTRAPSRVVDRRDWLAPASFFVVALLLHGRSIGGDYVFDGATAIRDNPLLAPFDPVRIATLDWWEGTGKPGGLYRPVALLWLAALRGPGWPSPALIDFANVMLHALVAWARFAMIVRLLGRAPRARLLSWLAALFALVHPTGVEVVAGQVGAADLMATLFATLSVVVATARFAGGKLLAGALAALAALSKESGVAVLPMAILFEALRAPSTGRGRRVLVAAAWSGAGVAIALACRSGAIGSLAGADDPVHAGFPAVARVASACAAFGAYLLPLLAAPWRQLAVVSLQDAWPAAGLTDPRALAGMAVILLLTAAPVAALRRGRPAVAFGCWVFVLFWLPASNLFFSTGAVAASRFLYPGMIGCTILLAIAADLGFSRGGAWRAVAAAIVVWFGPVMAVLTAVEIPAWRTPRALAELQVARAPASSFALVDLGELLAEPDPDRAGRLFERAATAPLPDVPGTRHPPEDLLETVFVARTRQGRIASARGDPAGADAAFAAAAEVATRGIEAGASLPYRGDWRRDRAYAVRQRARVALESARGNAAGASRSELIDRASRWLDEADLTEPGAIESVELRALELGARGMTESRRTLVEGAWKARPSDPVLRALWAVELRAMGRRDEATAIEIDLVLGMSDRVDAARALVTAREAVTSHDAGTRAKGRQLLARIAANANDMAVAGEAARALSAARKD